MTDAPDRYELRVTSPVQRQLERLPEGTAAAIVEFMLTVLVDNPHRVGGRLQRELAGLHSARRGAYRVIYEIDDQQHVVIVLRVDHRSRVYRSG
ncbi:MAG: type II toxin-antitoxin system RelE family toxin [Acidimicrobiia bacterium]